MEILIEADLALRTLRDVDAPALFSIVDQNREYLRRWLPWLDMNTDAKTSLDFIRDQTSKAQREEAIPFGIFFQGRLCGVAGYNWIDFERHACGLGYWLSEGLQGKGIVTRSVQAL